MNRFDTALEFLADIGIAIYIIFCLLLGCVWMSNQIHSTGNLTQSRPIPDLSVHEDAPVEK